MCAYISIGHEKNILSCASFFFHFFFFLISQIFSDYWYFSKFFFVSTRNKCNVHRFTIFQKSKSFLSWTANQIEKNINNLFMTFTMIIFHTLIQCKWNRRCICCERYLYLLIVLWKFSNFFLFYLISFDDFINSAQRFFPVVVVVKQMFF